MERASRRPAAGWLAFGVAVQAGFGALVVWLYAFLVLGASSAPASAPLAARLGLHGWWLDTLVDVALVLGFAVPHSILLVPAVRRRMQVVVPRALIGSVFTLCAMISLATMFVLWRPLPGVVWDVEGSWRLPVLAANGLAWLALLYSMLLAGFGYQTGFTSLWYALRDRPEPPRRFEPRGVYRLFRHPIYLSFLLIAWVVPTMSTAHLVLSVGFAAYTAIGSVLKDRRLIHHVGDAYRRYMAEVPGFPLIPAGPLGRVPWPAGPSAEPRPWRST